MSGPLLPRRYCELNSCDEWSIMTAPLSDGIPARLYVRLPDGSFNGVVEVLESGVAGVGLDALQIEEKVVGRIVMNPEEARWLIRAISEALVVMEGRPK